MRSDMLKAMCDVYRRGCNGQRRLFRGAKHFKLDEEGDVCDDVGNRLPMRPKEYGWDSKDHGWIGVPLNRFLEANVGRIWNDVYSEISKVMRNDVARRYKVMKKMVRWDVYIKTYIGDDGLVYANDAWRPGTCVETEVNSLYVHPNTGILCRGTGESYKSRNRRREKEIAIEREKSRKIVDESLQFHKVDGIWYRVCLAPFSEKFDNLHDALGCVSKNVGYYSSYIWVQREYRSKYGYNVYAVSKHTASKKEIRRYQLN